jgi:hypothetical protein
VGVLQKHVNIAVGWRPRLFVLKGGVLSYYHLAGPHGVNLVQLLDELREQGEVVLVGVEVGVLERQRRRQAGLNGSRDIRSNMSPRYEVHVEVCRVRESKSDVSKFYIESGATSLTTLRSETQDDRWVWHNAILESRQNLEESRVNMLPAGEHSAPHAEDHFLVQLEAIQHKLEELGASAEVKMYVVDLMRTMHTKYHRLADAEYDKRKTLLNILYRLENEKRELETAAAVEARLIDGNETPPQDDLEEACSIDVSHASMFVEEEDEEGSEDEFFECETYSDAVTSPAHGRQASLGDLAAFDTVYSLDEENLERASLNASPIKSTDRYVACTEMNQPPSMKEWLVKEGPAPSRRSSLPAPKQAEKSISLWSLIKEMVGKDLTRVCLPVYFNEPLSALELTAEDLEYSELLDEAYTYPAQSFERLVRIAAFAISPYSSTKGRTSKPFNPLLGETYELVHVEKGFRFISEKVSHHPTIIAAHSEGRGWTYQGDAEIKSKFWGRSIELKPEGMLKLDFDDGDSYTWNKVTTSINNLILGKIYVDHGGIMRIRNANTDLAIKIRFKETSMLFDRDPRQVEGFIEVQGRRLEYPKIQGHWDSSIKAIWDMRREETLWTVNPPPENPTRYNLTSFAIQLNEITDGLREKLAPTDSRLRPDQTFTEQGMWEEANAEKQRLEHKQRAARKAADQGVPLKPRWFDIHYEKLNLSRTSSRHVSGTGLSFEFNGEYWIEREKREYTNCRDIFSNS